MYESPTTDKQGRPNLARYIFLDPGSQEFFVGWEAAAVNGRTAPRLARYPLHHSDTPWAQGSQGPTDVTPTAADRSPPPHPSSPSWAPDLSPTHPEDP